MARAEFLVRPVSFLDTRYLKLDQTTPQTISGGIPLLDVEISDFDHLDQIVNKRYVDSAVSSLIVDWYATNTDSGVEDYKLTTTNINDLGDTQQSITKDNILDGDYLAGWISADGDTPPILPLGIYNLVVYLEKTGGNKDIQVYWELVERLSGGTENVLATSSYSDVIGTTKQQYIVPLILDTDQIPVSGSRIVGKIYAYVSGSGNDPSLAIYYENNSMTRWSMPTTIEVLANQFVDISGDTMTGALAINTNSATALHVEQSGVHDDVLIVNTSTGRVGIGTAEPGALLHLQKNLDAEFTALILDNPSTTDTTAKSIRLLFQGKDTIGTTKYPASIRAVPGTGNWVGGNLVFETLWNQSPWTLVERMRITDTGKVGIGTTSPSELLEVEESTAGTTGRIFIKHTDTTNTASHAGIRVYSGGGGGDALFNFGITGQIDWTMGIDNSDADKFKIATASSLGTASDRLTIDKNGNVGIGTTDPGYKLEINATGSVFKAQTDASIGVPIFDLYGNSGNNEVARFFANKAIRLGGGVLHINTSGLSIKTGSYPTRALEVSGDATITGKVGIGKTSPATILDFAGAYTSQELSADPADPAEGNYVVWMSDGTGTGDDGDIIMKINAGGTVKTITLVDFSAV